MPKAKYLTKRDSMDFRDKIYQPALIPLPPVLLPRKTWMNVRDQGALGSCSGFGLAAVIDYLNAGQGIKEKVSARMLYEMTKRHDHWAGDDYEGSSARGAMKGWHKNGVCPEADWPYDPDDAGYLSVKRQDAALQYPLGAYYRVLLRRSDLHAAVNETGAVYVTADTHDGWKAKNIKNGTITWDGEPGTGGNGHAFAIVGYTKDGFIVQNSWGEKWGKFKYKNRVYPGCALWTYPDFEENLWDAWVARIALPVESAAALSGGSYSEAGGKSEARVAAPPQHEIRDHYIHIDDGQFDPFGDYPSHEKQVKEIIDRAVASGAKHIMLYAHGGLNSVKASAQRVAAWRPAFERNGVYELHFIWETGLKEEFRDLLLGKEDMARKRVGGFSDWWDKFIERTTGLLGHAVWNEMQSDAEMAFFDDPVDPERAMAGTKVLRMLVERTRTLAPGRRPALHLVGHSAGSIWHAHLLDRWRALGGPAFRQLILFAPACTIDVFRASIKPAVTSGIVAKLHHFLLDEQAELDDTVAGIYRKSLLWLVARSYEERGREVPILGMQKFWKNGGRLDKKLFVTYDTKDRRDWTASPSHGGFDNDKATMNSMLRLILGKKPGGKAGFRDDELKGY